MTRLSREAIQDAAGSVRTLAIAGTITLVLVALVAVTALLIATGDRRA